MNKLPGLSKSAGFLAAVGVLFLPTPATAQVKHFEHQVTAKDGKMSVDLSGISSLSGSTLTIRNHSGSKLDFPFIWNSTSVAPVTSLAAFGSLASTAGSDEAFAIGVWRYVSGRTNPYCSAGSSYEQVRDPLRILYGSGFGCCGQLAVTLASLWSGASRMAAPSSFGHPGFAAQRRYPTRIAVMAFHTIPEIYYGNAWHMLDPDHRVFYRNADGSIASVAQILANPSLVARTPDGTGWNSETMAELYRSNASTLQYTFGLLDDSTPATPLFTLLPYESMELADQNSWPTAVYDPISAGQAPPQFSGIGEITFARRITFNGRSTALLDDLSDVETAVQADGRTALVNSSALTGSLMVTKSGPFPILGLKLRGEFFSNDPSGSISVEASPDGLTWSAPIIVPVTAGAAASPRDIDLTSLLVGRTKYFVKILLNGSSPRSLGLYNMEVRMHGQMAAQMFPLLEAGRVNTFNYQDLSPNAQERSVEIEFAVPAGSRELKNLTATSLTTEDPRYSVAADYRASHLVDGNPLTLAYPAHAQIDYEINLPALSEVKQVSISWGYFGTDRIYVNSWSLYGRRATGDWTLIKAGEFPNASEVDIPVDTTATDLRLRASGDNWIGAYELKVYGDEIAPIRSSRQLTPMSVTSNIPISSTQSYPTGNLMDGNSSSLAYPAAPEVDYELDFGENVSIDLASIDWGYFGTSPLYVQRWTIFGQRDGEFGWTRLAQGGFPGADATQTEIHRTVRRLRLRADGPNWIGVYEFSVNGAPSGPGNSAFNGSQD